MYYVSRITAGIAILGLLAAAWLSIRLAQADSEFRRATPESVARAVEIMPRNVEYLSFRALQLDYDGADSGETLRRIAALAPLFSAPRIRLGLAAEIRGGFDSAEKWLLDAARVDRQFEPRWTLANYYFRRGNEEAFWKWLREALRVSYGDRRPAFDLCWRESGDAEKILARAIPARHEVLATYLAYLLSERRLPAASAVALQLAAARDATDRPLLFWASDALLDAQDGSPARALWRAMGYPSPEGIAGGDFATSASGHGFDWRAPDVRGAVHLDVDSPPAHRISFDGNEPETCEVLRRFVSLHAGARYVLRWEARTRSFLSPSGLEWRINGRPIASVKTVARDSTQGVAIASGTDWRSGELVFIAAGDLGALTLQYQRPSGQPRAEGSVELRQVTIAEAR